MSVEIVMEWLEVETPPSNLIPEMTKHQDVAEEEHGSQKPNRRV